MMLEVKIEVALGGKDRRGVGGGLWGAGHVLLFWMLVIEACSISETHQPEC